MERACAVLAVRRLRRDASVDWSCDRDKSASARVLETARRKERRHSAAAAPQPRCQGRAFLCALRYSAVHASFAAFNLLLNRRLHLAFRNRNT